MKALRFLFLSSLTQLSNMEMSYVLIISTESGKANAFAQEINAKFVGNGKNNAKYFLYDIDNKYYSVQVMLYVTDTLELPLEISVDEIEALIVYYSPKDKEMQILNEYVTLIHSLSEAEVFILACEAFPDINKKDKTIEWCHIHKFELVDIELPEPLNAVHDMEQEKYGIERIIEALHTHTWPNRMLKGFPNGRIPTSNESNIAQIKDQLENIQLNPPPYETDHLLMNTVLDGMMGEDNADFGKLFSQLIAMKEHAASLSPSNRRTAAEQLVTAFWKSLGGDQAEIEDLDE